MRTRETVFKIGDVFNPKMTPWQGAMYSYQDDMHQVILSFPDIRAHEKLAIERGVYRFGLYVEDDVLFLLFKADGPYGWNWSGISWHDLPYSYHKVEPQARTRPIPAAEIPENLGVMIFVFLLDAPTGRIVAMNAKNASHHFSKELHTAILKQAQRTYNHDAFHGRVEAIRDLYPTPEALAARAQAKCLGGIYEGS